MMHEMYNVIGALRGCLVVKFDSCNNLSSSIHTVSVIILHLWLVEYQRWKFIYSTLWNIFRSVAA